MLKNPQDQQVKYEFVCIDDLVPKDHLLRKIARYIDFSFIREKVKDLYCPDNVKKIALYLSRLGAGSPLAGALAQAARLLRRLMAIPSPVQLSSHACN